MWSTPLPLQCAIVRTEAVGSAERPECGKFSAWRREEVLPLATTVEGRLEGRLLISVRYHHAKSESESESRGVLNATLRRAMAQLVTLKRAFGVTTPEVVRVDHWAYTDERRMPSAPDATVGAEHINGGCTLLPNDPNSPNRPPIYCYRQEEYPKVWLHEGVHYFRLDFGGEAPVRGASLGIRADQPVLVNEAWTELVAEAFAVAFRTASDIGSAKWSRAWKREHAHALKQSACLLKHNGYARAEELFDGSRAWRERTNALAYYVLRAALMPAPDAWLGLMGLRGLMGLMDLAANATITRDNKKAYRAFMELLQARLTAPPFRKALQRAMSAKNGKCVSLRMMA